MNVQYPKMNLLICLFHGILMKQVLTKLMISLLIMVKSKWIVCNTIILNQFLIYILSFFR